MKKWQRVLLIIGIIVGCLACIANIVLAIKFQECGTNIFTAISGWVSGIATIILGVVAVVQNRNYKIENDSFLQRQKEENAALITKQTNYTIFNNIINQRCNYVERVKERLQCFITNFNFRKITLWLAELQVEADSNRPCDDSSPGALINHFYNEITCEYADIKQFIKNDWCVSEEKDALLDSLDSYIKTLTKLYEEINYGKIKQTIGKFNADCVNKLSNVLMAKNNYITWLDVDLNKILTTKSGDIDFIKTHYCYDKEQNNG